MQTTSQKLGSAIACLILSCSNADAARYAIRWVVMQEPSISVNETARDFAARVEEETHGELHVEILTRTQYQTRFNGGKTIGYSGMVQDLASGKAEILETHTHAFGVISPGLWSLSMPFLFRNYAHAEAVMEGPVGRSILDLLLQKSRVLRGLALTYGGYGIVALTARDSPNLGSLRGSRIQVMNNPVSQAMARKMGAEPITVPAGGFVLLAQNDLSDGIDTTYAQFQELGMHRAAGTVLETKHCLVTGLIAVNEKFFQSLPKKFQEVVQRSAAEAARRERRRNIETEMRSREALEELGVRIVGLRGEQKIWFDENMATMVGSVGTLFGIDGMDLWEAVQKVPANGESKGP